MKRIPINIPNILDNAAPCARARCDDTYIFSLHATCPYRLHCRLCDRPAGRIYRSAQKHGHRRRYAAGSIWPISSCPCSCHDFFYRHRSAARISADYPARQRAANDRRRHIPIFSETSWLRPTHLAKWRPFLLNTAIALTFLHEWIDPWHVYIIYVRAWYYGHITAAICLFQHVQKTQKELTAVSHKRTITSVHYQIFCKKRAAVCGLLYDSKMLFC